VKFGIRIFLLVAAKTKAQEQEQSKQNIFFQVSKYHKKHQTRTDKYTQYTVCWMKQHTSSNTHHSIEVLHNSKNSQSTAKQKATPKL
jgi:hypothetical protein